MGVRLYNAKTGLLTSVDLVIGGNTTAYTYPQDPLNLLDLTGESKGGKQHSSTKAYTFDELQTIQGVSCGLPSTRSFWSCILINSITT